MMGLTEDEILNYLMTSEFDEGLTPQEYKLLLKKFRNFYRILRGRYDTTRNELEIKQREIKEIKQDREIKYHELLLEKNKLSDFNSHLLSKKLSWKERFKGKIILDKDEIERF